MHELGVRATPFYTGNTTAQNFVENRVHHSLMKQLHLKITKPLGAIETDRKSLVYFEGLQHLDYEPVQPLETILTDASV